MFSKVTYLIILFWTLPAIAFMADVPLSDAAQEKRAQMLFTEIRCVVCEGQTIADSNSEVAGDMRRNIRQNIASGMSDEKIKSELAGNYGDMILMKPPLKASTLLLWLGPWLILALGAISAYFYFRGTKSQKSL